MLVNLLTILPMDLVRSKLPYKFIGKFYNWNGDFYEGEFFQNQKHGQGVER